MANSLSNKVAITPRELFLTALLLLLLLFALFPGVLRGETVLPAPLLFDSLPWREHAPIDKGTFNNPPSIEAFILFHKYYSVAQQAISAGEWPLWNPLEFTGIPLLANYQSAVVYPPRILHALFPIAIGTTIFIFFKLWCCGMTAYLFARICNLRRSAATFASIGWMLSGYHLAWVYHAIPDISAWLPLLLVGAELLATRRLRSGFMTMTIAAVLLLLAGHPESAFTGSLGAGAYFFIRLFQCRAMVRPAKPIALASLSWTIALLIASVQILPFIEYLPHSQTFHERIDNPEAQHFIAPGMFPIFWVPRFFGAQPDGAFWADGVNVSSFTLMAYSGITTFCALSLLISRRLDHATAARALALVIPSAIFLLLAFRLPALEFLFSLPPFSSTWGSWYLAFPMMALCFLAAMGLNHWLSQSRRLRELTVPTAICIVIAALIAFRFSLDYPLLAMQSHVSYVTTQLFIATGLCLLSLTLLACCAFPRAARIAAPALCALVAVDLLWAARGIVCTSPRSDILFETPLTQHLQQLGPTTRLNAASARVMAGLLQPFGLDELHAYDGILPARMWTFLGAISGEPRSRLEPLTSVSYYLHDPRLEPTFHLEDSSRFIYDQTIDGVAIYRDAAAFPRAFLVNRIEYYPNEKELISRMRQSDFDPRDTGLVENQLSIHASNESSPPGTATIVNRTHNTVTINASAKVEALLVLTDAFYPGWKANIDGAPTEIYPAYLAFRSVIVPEGNHVVEFIYSPLSFKAGFYISMITLIICSLYAVNRLRAKRPRHA